MAALFFALRHSCAPAHVCGLYASGRVVQCMSEVAEYLEQHKIELETLLSDLCNSGSEADTRFGPQDFLLSRLLAQMRVTTMDSTTVDLPSTDSFLAAVDERSALRGLFERGLRSICRHLIWWHRSCRKRKYRAPRRRLPERGQTRGRHLPKLACAARVSCHI